jgi:hypothetical protein
MLVARLQQTRMGCTILALAPTGNDQDLYGEAAWVINHTILCRVLTGMSSAAIVADPVSSTHIATNSTSGGFAFAAPARDLRLVQGNRWRSPLENMEDA